MWRDLSGPRVRDRTPTSTRDSGSQRLTHPLRRLRLLKLHHPGSVTDRFVPLLNPIPILWKCWGVLLVLGSIAYPTRSGLGPEPPPPDLLQVSDPSEWWSRLVVDLMTVERVKYNWEDPLNLESQLTEEEIAIR